MSWLRGVLFSAGMLAALIPGGVAVLLLSRAPLAWRYGIANGYCRFVLFWLRLTCGVAHRIEGAQWLSQERVVVLANHQSTWETFMLQLKVRHPVWVAKQELFRLPFFGWGLSALRAVPIDRSSGRRAVESIVSNGSMRLREGHSVIIFPEGTRVAAGEQRRFKLGGAVLAVEAGVPVVPVAHNAGRFWGRRRFRKTPGTVLLRAGAPIPSEGKSAEQLLAEVETWIRTAQAELDESQGARQAS